MTELERWNLRDKLDWEGGLEYLIEGNTYEDTIDDPKFHRLRKAYAKAHQALADYIEPTTEETPEGYEE
jgi:hypothetical protein